jgi:predicted metalloprotease
MAQWRGRRRSRNVIDARGEQGSRYPEPKPKLFSGAVKSACG